MESRDHTDCQGICDKARDLSTPTSPSRLQVYLLLISVILLWGINWPIMKVGLAYIPPLTFGALRMFIGALVLFVIVQFLGRSKLPQAADRRVLLSEAVLHMAAPLALMNIALLHVEAGRSAVLSFTTPLWIVPIAVFYLRDRLTAAQCVGVLGGLTGIAVLFNPTDLNWSSSDIIIGNSLLLIAALTWAIAILVARRHRWQSTPLQLAPWQMLIASALLFAPAAIFEDLEDIIWSPELIAVLAFNGPVASGFCFWGALVIAKELPSVTVSMAFLGVPVAGVFFSTIALGESMTLTLLGGLTLIILGIALVNVNGAPFREKKER